MINDVTMTLTNGRITLEYDAGFAIFYRTTTPPIVGARVAIYHFLQQFVIDVQEAMAICSTCQLACYGNKVPLDCDRYKPRVQNG